MLSRSPSGDLGGRAASPPTVSTFSLDFTNQVSATDYPLCTIPASATNPVVLTAKAIVVVADDSATSSALKLGTSANGTQLLSSVDLKAAAGTNYEPTNKSIVLTADTTIYGRITRVGTPTAGQVAIVLSMFSVNISQP